MAQKKSPGAEAAGAMSHFPPSKEGAGLFTIAGLNPAKQSPPGLPSVT